NWRKVPPRRVVVRDRRHGWPQDRQAHRVAREEKGGAAACGRGGLKLPELLFEPVDVVAREIIRLFRDSVATDPTAKRTQLIVEPLDFGRAQVGQLFEAEEAERVQRIL